MKLSKDTFEAQKQLADYCRTGDDSLAQNIPGITSLERLKHYRRLLVNNVYGVLDKAFPICQKKLSKEEWLMLREDFFSKHDSEVPQIWKMPFEFYLFVKIEEYGKKLNKPYLNNLLYFEWLEIELHTMSDSPPSPFKEEGNLIEDFPVFTKEFKIVSLNYPVYINASDDINQLRGPYFLLGFRNWETKEVHFMDIGLVLAVFLETIVSEEYTSKKALELVCKRLNIDYPSTKQAIRPMLQGLKDKNFLMGFKEVC